MKTCAAWKTKEHGAALIVALIFLVVLTILGTSASINNTLQERMASNARNQDLAFQAAELALKAADVAFATEPNLTCVDNTPTPNNPDDGLRCQQGTSSPNLPHPNDGDYWRNTFDWTTDRVILTGVEHVASQPSYVVERMRDATCPNGTSNCRFYRVTARGVGGSSDAVVILQTMYRF